MNTVITVVRHTFLSRSVILDRDPLDARTEAANFDREPVISVSLMHTLYIIMMFSFYLVIIALQLMESFLLEDSRFAIFNCRSTRRE